MSDAPGDRIQHTPGQGAEPTGPKTSQVGAPPAGEQYQIAAQLVQQLEIGAGMPYPVPSMLERYEQIYPGAAEMISRERTVRPSIVRTWSKGLAQEHIRSMCGIFCAAGISALIIGGAILVTLRGYPSSARPWSEPTWQRSSSPSCAAALPGNANVKAASWRWLACIDARRRPRGWSHRGGERPTNRRPSNSSPGPATCHSPGGCTTGRHRSPFHHQRPSGEITGWVAARACMKASRN